MSRKEGADTEKRQYGRYRDLTGQKFGYLSVLERVGSNHRNEALWRCKCICGNEITTTTTALKSGNTKSCGRCRVLHTRHGGARTPLYRTWANMLQRCCNPKHTAYENYGGRGITVCDEWTDFAKFQDWAYANGYCEDLTIDRIDNDKGYTPDNCKWVDRKVQAQNRRTNIQITAEGETKCLKAWSEELQISYGALYSWYRKHGKAATESWIKSLLKQTKCKK